MWQCVCQLHLTCETGRLQCLVPLVLCVVAGQIASADTVIKTTLYIVHERIWDRIEWGKQYDVEFNI